MTGPSEPRTARTSSSGRLRRALRLIGWHALVLVVGAVLIAIVGEAWLRRPAPFMTSNSRHEFVPDVGILLKPDMEVRHTNRLDFWTVSRTNSLGFLDREPPNPERAAASCHVAVIGDSFVEAREVSIEDKFHVRIEELAARDLPHLDVTTSAFGHSNTSQIHQLPFYDEYARLLRPKLVVLVFAFNDLKDNSPILYGLSSNYDPDHLPYASAEKGPDGKMKLRPPDPDYRKFRLQTPRPPEPESWIKAGIRKAREVSWFARWLEAERFALYHPRGRVLFKKAEALKEDPRYAELTGWRLPTAERERRSPLRFGVPTFAQADLPPVFEDALVYTAYGLEQFKERAMRDGAELVILASHSMKTFGPRLFDRMSEIAAAQDIPVIDQADYILRQGAELEDANWSHDMHWNVAGHGWAAEALLDYLKRRPEVCLAPPGVDD